MKFTLRSRYQTKEPSGLWTYMLAASWIFGTAVVRGTHEELRRGLAALLFYVIVPCGAALWMWLRVYQSRHQAIRPRLTLLQSLVLMLGAGIEVGLLVEVAKSREADLANLLAALFPMIIMAFYIWWEPVLTSKRRLASAQSSKDALPLSAESAVDAPTLTQRAQNSSR